MELIPSFLIYLKFNDELTERFLEIAKPIIHGYGDLRIVDKASNDPSSSNYWLNIVHRLTFASDFVLKIENSKNQNIVFEDDFLFRSSTGGPFHAPAQLFGISKIAAGLFCRPTEITLAFTCDVFRRRKNVRKKYKKGTGYFVCDVRSSDEEIAKLLEEYLGSVVADRYNSLVEIAEYSEALLEYYQIMQLIILQDPEIEQSVTIYRSKRQEIRYDQILVNEEELKRLNYNIKLKLLKEKTYVMFKMQLDMIALIMSYKFLSIQNWKLLRSKFREFIKLVPAGRTERKFFAIYIGMLGLLAIAGVILLRPYVIIRKWHLERVCKQINNKK